jgi:hypothetical protein
MTQRAQEAMYKYDNALLFFSFSQSAKVYLYLCCGILPFMSFRERFFTVPMFTAEYWKYKHVNATTSWEKTKVFAW